MDTETGAQHLKRILAIGQELASPVALEPLLKKIITAAVELTNAEEVSILLLDIRTGELHPHATSNGSIGQFTNTPLSTADAIASAVLASAKPMIIPDDHADPRYVGEAKQQTGRSIHSLLAMPLQFKDRCIGVLQVVNSQRMQQFSQDDVEMLMALAAHAAVAIENARLLEAVKQQRGQLRDLSSRLAESEDAERQRLARELHDLIGQDLTMLHLSLCGLRKQMTGEAMGLCSRLDDSLELVDQTAEHIRAVIADLHPPVLEDGLLDALRFYGARFTSRTGIEVNVQGEEPIPRLSTPVENGMLRIAQEALTNIAKHAQATTVTVSVEVNNGTIRLVITDDGIGFDPTHLIEPNGRMGWGLLTMTERAAAIGGHYRLDSCPQQGTRLTVEVARYIAM